MPTKHEVMGLSAADRDTPSGRTAPTRTVDRALALLAEVCSSDQVTLADLARRTQLPPSTALRLLRTLESTGFAHRDDAGGFHAGPRMIQLGALAYGRQNLVAEAEPAMRRIVSECGESTYLAVPGTVGTACTSGWSRAPTRYATPAGWAAACPPKGQRSGAAMSG